MIIAEIYSYCSTKDCTNISMIDKFIGRQKQVHKTRSIIHIIRGRMSPSDVDS